MIVDNVQRELRDTLAIEIAREMVRGFFNGSPYTLSEMQAEGLARVYSMADAVLSGRDGRDCGNHCPTCIARDDDPLCARKAATVEHPEPITVLPNDPRLPPGMQAQADEGFVRANWGGICKIYRNGPYCPEGHFQVHMGGFQERGGGDIRYKVCTIPMPTEAQAWALARVMTEARVGKAAQ